MDHEVDDTPRAAGERVSDTQRLPRAFLAIAMTNGTLVLRAAAAGVPCDLHPVPPNYSRSYANAALVLGVTATSGRHVEIGVCGDCLAEALAVQLGRLHVLAGGALEDLHH